MTIEQRLTNLENLVNALIKSQNNKDFYDKADKDGIRQTEGVHGEKIEQNASDITDTMTGLTDTYENVETNTSDIDACMNAITELYEMIGGNE